MFRCGGDNGRGKSQMSEPILAPVYSPGQIPRSDWSKLPGFADRSALSPVYDQRHHVMAKVVSFAAGGFELTASTVDLQAAADRYAACIVPGPRKPFDERDPKDKIRAVRRAGQKVRHAVRQMGAMVLMTLTTRQSENSPEELARMWKRLVRALDQRMGITFDYVAVPERHPSNPKHWHLHIAINKLLPVNTVRGLWWAICGGRGMGNVDLQWIKMPAHLGAEERSRKVAKYLSKYMSKDLMLDHRPDKKNYWRSVFEMPESNFHWLEARPEDKAGQLEEVMRRFGCVMAPGNHGPIGWFFFPDGSGFWYSHVPGRVPEPPPPF